jgi:polygalacturonase
LTGTFLSFFLSFCLITEFSRMGLAVCWLAAAAAGRVRMMMHVRATPLLRLLLSLTTLAAAAPGARGTIFDVTKHGAKGDGHTRADGAIEATFAACAAAGGGVVLFPAPGRYVTGPWELACNDSVVTIEEGASVVSFTTNGSTRGWPLGPLTSPEPSQGLTDLQAAPFLLAHFARNVTLRGAGTLDAGGKPFWDEHCGNWWCPKWAPGVSSKHPYAWRPFMLRIDHSSDFKVEGLRFEATAFWCIVPVHSQHIEVSNVCANPPHSDDSCGARTHARTHARTA